MLTALLVLLALPWAFVNRKTIRQYREESATIPALAKQAITEIVGCGELPKRLYRQDLKMLKVLSRRDKVFAAVAKKIAGAFGT